MIFKNHLTALYELYYCTTLLELHSQRGIITSVCVQDAAVLIVLLSVLLLPKSFTFYPLNHTISMGTHIQSCRPAPVNISYDWLLILPVSETAGTPCLHLVRVGERS